MQLKEDHISNLVEFLSREGPVIFLESQMPDHPESQKSYIAARPRSWIKTSENKVERFEDGQKSVFPDDPWNALKEFQSQNNTWLFGYFGYDLKNHLEDLESKNKQIISVPDLFFMNPGLLLEIDELGNVRVIKGEIPDEKEFFVTERPLAIEWLKCTSKEEYVAKVQKAQQDIYEGKYYEINLSHPLEFTFKGNPWELYRRMRAAGPVPFGGFMNFQEGAVCCASPERFLKRKGNRVWSQPIKGTALRAEGKDGRFDIEKLQASEKERAENLMIVDLVRNDLGRVAKKNSVQVSGLFEIQSFETVHQMVSTIECMVENSTDSIEVIKACFPMGSMTGAPKIAAMKAIEEYEEYRRGIYSGAIGYFMPNGDFDFNVVIRTAIINADKLVYPVGGAITNDSSPDEEWEETLIKARALTNIFENLKKA